MRHDLIVGVGTTIVEPAAGNITVLGGVAELAVEASVLRRAGGDYSAELQYLALLKELLDQPLREDRTGTGTHSVFGRQIRFNLEKGGFPLLTTKRVFWRGVVAELLWMLSGSTDASVLQAQDVHIWDEWADENGQLGPVYGKQWRSWEGYEGHLDQIADLIANLKAKPYDRGHVISAWNVADLDRMALRPCHCLFQFYVHDGKLSCQLYQRSADVFLGVPFNIASYALLTHLIAREVGLGVGEFIHTFGDVHLYSNHVDQAKEQLNRSPYDFPKLVIDGNANIFSLELPDIRVEGYRSHPALKAEVSV